MVSVPGSSTTSTTTTTTTNVVQFPTLPMQLAGPIPLTDAIADIIISTYLPAEAIDYGWDAALVKTRWAGSISATVRLYWLMRVNDTASYIDISEPGGSFQLTKQWQQAKAMLEYWDGVILKEKTTERVAASTSFGSIRARRRGNNDGCC